MKLILVFLILSFSIQAPAHAEQPFVCLCYHDIQDRLDGSDPLVVSTANLVAQFEWLKGNGYHVIGIDDILASYGKGDKLPEKAVILTFDDGLSSFYTRVFPLLKTFNFKAIACLVGIWESCPENKTIAYGRKTLSRRNFLSWPQIKEMRDSGLVEIAAHSWDSHRGIKGNPKGNLQPAYTTHKYSVSDNRYENDHAYLARITDDLKRCKTLLEEKAGVSPRVIAWPYGSYNKVTMAVADGLGMKFTLALNDEMYNDAGNPFIIYRSLVYNNPDLGAFAWSVINRRTRDPFRAIDVDIDWLYPDKKEERLGKVLELVKKLKINVVILKPWHDSDGNEKADTLYFHNGYLPTRADIFNRIAWQLETRCRVEAYARMPLSNGFDLDLQGVKSIFEDLSKYSHFSGILLNGANGKKHSALKEANTLAEIVRTFEPTAKTGIVLPFDSSGDGFNTYKLINNFDYILLPFSKDKQLHLSTVLQKSPILREKLVLSVIEPKGDGGQQPFPASSLVTSCEDFLQAGIRHISYRPHRLPSLYFDFNSAFRLLSMESFPFSK